MMLRMASVLLLMTIVLPAGAEGTANATAVVQERQPAQQAPKQDCEKRTEGVSA